MAPTPSILSRPQISTLSLRFGDRARLRARVEVTPAGLLAIGGLTAMILLAVVPVVRAAKAPPHGGG